MKKSQFSEAKIVEILTLPSQGQSENSEKSGNIDFRKAGHRVAGFFNCIHDLT